MLTYAGDSLPMLPARLANNLCSLLPGEDRLCVSVSFEVTRAGRVVRMLTYADVCYRMLTYAGVCWRMLAYADVC